MFQVMTVVFLESDHSGADQVTINELVFVQHYTKGGNIEGWSQSSHWSVNSS